MTPTAALLMPSGFEEIEAITCLDLLRRAGIPVVSLGLEQGVILGSRQTKHLADFWIEEQIEESWDLLLLPGGVEGVANLKKDERVRKMVTRHYQQGKWIAAICAAPTILFEWGLLEGKNFICHPSVQKTLEGGGLQKSERVVVSGCLITSLAAGSSMEFAYEIIRQLLGDAEVKRVDQGVCFYS